RRSGDQTAVRRIADIDPIDRAAAPPGGFFELLGDRQAGCSRTWIETEVQSMGDGASAYDESARLGAYARVGSPVSVPSEFIRSRPARTQDSDNAVLPFGPTTRLPARLQARRLFRNSILSGQVLGWVARSPALSMSMKATTFRDRCRGVGY